MCMHVHFWSVRLHVCFGVQHLAVYMWYWVELRTVALGIQCYCCRSTLRQSSGKSRWAFHVEKKSWHLYKVGLIFPGPGHSPSLLSVSLYISDSVPWQLPQLCPCSHHFFSSCTLTALTHSTEEAQCILKMYLTNKTATPFKFSSVMLVNTQHSTWIRAKY